MNAELIFTGSELLLGHVLNIHSQYLGVKLSEMGIEVKLHTTIGDEWEGLIQLLRQAIERSDLIITTGGLGPTADDLTKETVATVLGLPMVLDKSSLETLQETYRRRGMAMPESIVRQAYFPEGSRILPNTQGTAPGALIEKGDKIIAMLPGPPAELAAMFECSIAPYLFKKVKTGKVAKYKVFKLNAISESAAYELLKDLEDRDNLRIAFVARPGEVHVRIMALATGAEEAEKKLAELSEKVRCRLQDYIFGYDGEILEETVGKLLTAQGQFIAVAESCTGGLIAARLTDIPGSSAYLKGGLIAYSNEVKNKILGVPLNILDHYGAVSEQTATAMAQGVRKLIGSDLGLAVTGIAGPGGSSPAKPVGLVYISLAAGDGASCREFRFPGYRASVRRGTVNAALNMVKQYLLARDKKSK